MGLPAGDIYLVDEAAEEIVLTAHKGFSEKFVETVRRIPLGTGLSGRAARTGRIIIGAHLPEDERIDPNHNPAIQMENIQSAVSVPLKTKDRLLGVLNLATHSPKHFSEEDIRLLETIGNEIGVAIENTQLLEKMSRLSITDELTGLYSRRHFYKVVDREIHRVQHYSGFFSLVMLDLDGFKEYNDKFGHINGDSVLRSLAQMLKSTLRKSDTAFRYGGDEFAIVLPATDAHGARKIVERLRLKWSQELKVTHPMLEAPLGFSAGIAQAPDNGETVDGLVFLADTALYHSKRQGGYECTLVSDLETLPPNALNMTTLDQVFALSAMVDARDPYTYGHSMRVATISEMIGRTIGLMSRELADLHTASLLHDIGKVGVPDSILIKPGKLTKDEQEIMQKHAAEGARIVGYIKELAAVVPMIWHHHEWYDGGGYPDGLKGEDIPLGGRIIAVADAYDTMTTPRLYRTVITHQEALEELRQCSDTQFDPRLTQALCHAMNDTVRQD